MRSMMRCLTLLLAIVAAPMALAQTAGDAANPVGAPTMSAMPSSAQPTSAEASASAPGGAAAGAGSASAGPSAGGTPSPNYKLGIGDHVRVNVYNEPDLSGEFTVGATGTLALPLIGDVPVLGDNANQVVSKVETKLRDGYLKDPHVSLEVLTYRPFYILGEVTKPGEYPYSNGLTVLNAVATAEGFTYRANKRTAFIKRAGSNEEKSMKITPGLEIGPGDTIRIGERYF